MPHASRLATLAILSLLLGGCATAQALRQAQDAEFLQDYDRAIVEYTRVLREDPDNRDARQGLERAQLRGALEHFSRGRRLAQAGRLEEAVAELQIAAELNPSSPEIQDLLAVTRTQLQTKVEVSRNGRTELESLIERARLLPAAGRELPAARLPDTLLWNGGVRELYSYLGKLAEITVLFDPQFRDQPVNIDLRGQSLEQALTTISRATGHFYRVTAQNVVTIIPDTPAKRQEYDQERVVVFPLSNADLKEVSDTLRIIIDARRVFPMTANNMIAIRDTPDRLAAAGRLIAALDRARPEVVVDIEILEVDRTLLREYGLQIASPDTPPIGLNGQVSVNDGSATLEELANLSRSDILFTALPSLFYRLLKQDSNTRTLANTQLRISDGQTSRARFGEEVPVPVTTFAPIATGGVAQQPITSFNYRTIGVNIEITPRTHHDNYVTLALALEVSSLLGTGFGGLPTFGTREVETVNRLQDGETNLLAGLIRDDDRRVHSGIPGLSDIPGIGRMFGHNRRQSQETDVIITLRPRILRVLDISDADLRAFEVGGLADPGAAFDLEVPLPAPAPAPQVPDAPAQPFPPGPQPPGPRSDPQPIGPILPPAPPPPAGGPPQQ